MTGTESNFKLTLNPNVHFCFLTILLFFQTPKILSVEPEKGIKSGGTLLAITGKHLSCGSSIQIEMADDICSIVNITKSDMGLETIYCITPKYVNIEQLSSWNQKVGSKLKGQQTAIRMMMDDYSLLFDESFFKFEYDNDPKIVDIKPDRSIFSGGLTMSISGTDFENVQSAVLILSPVNSHSDIENLKNSKLTSVRILLTLTYY